MVLTCVLGSWCAPLPCVGSQDNPPSVVRKRCPYASGTGPLSVLPLASVSAVVFEPTQSVFPDASLQSNSGWVAPLIRVGCCVAQALSTQVPSCREAFQCAPLSLVV